MTGRRGARPRFEALESRRLLATFTVTSTGDAPDVEGTLRWAIGQANAATGADTINFAIPGSGPHTIQPATALPELVGQVTIDGSTQLAGASTPQVVLDGSLLAGDADGLVFATTSGSSSSNSALKWLAIGGFGGAGVRIRDAVDTVTITANFIGTDAAGTSARPNGVGVAIDASASNVLGGPDAALRNLISGNTGAGIALRGVGATLNTIQANLIGTTLDGNTALPNAVGILIGPDAAADSGARGNVIGGSVAAARNVISGNSGAGIRITGVGASSNRIEGNYIGTRVGGLDALPNDVGVEILAGATTNTVGGTATTLRNVIAGNTTADVKIDASGDNRVSGNYIGTQAAGTAAITGASADGIGVLIQNGAIANTVGGTTSTAGNVIAGHGGGGIVIHGRTTETGTLSSRNVVQANTIGAAAGGGTAVPNRVGVLIDAGATENTIGGLSDITRNTISGNTEDGVRLVGDTSTGNVVQGNYIGIASDNATALANGGAGVKIDGPNSTQVGGTTTGAANTIAYNGGAGVLVLAGVGNAIRRNSIFQNVGLGIDLGGDGGTANDPGDVDSGPNNLQNAPTLTKAYTGGGSTVVEGSISSGANLTYSIEIYTDPIPDPTGAGEGRRYLTTVTVTTDANGFATFKATATVTPGVPAGQAISALAIAPNGDTSEFAVNVSNVELTTSMVITQTAEAATAPTGAFFRYTITVRNDGPSDAPTATIADTLPTGATFVGGSASQGTISQSGSVVTFNLGLLPAGGSATVVVTIVTPSTVPASPGTITNTARVSPGAGVTNTNAANDTATVTTTIVQGANLLVTQSAAPSPAQVGSEFQFVILVTNTGTTRATGVVVTETLPEGLTIVTASTSQGTVAVAGNVVTATLGELPPTSQATVTAGASARLVVVVRPSATGTIAAVARATATEPQSVAGANVATLNVVVGAAVPPVTTTAPEVAEAFRAGPSRWVVAFTNPIDATTARRLRNYTLATPGADGKLGTPDDVRLRLRSAQPSGDGLGVRLFTAEPVAGHPRTRLVVRGRPTQGLRGRNGLFLAGTDGASGTDYVANLPGRARRS